MPRFRQPARLSGAEDIQDFARDQLRVESRRLRSAELGARAGDVEGVHRLRVAIRRARATLALFAPVIRRPAHLDAELQSLGREVGTMRDLDVLSAAVTTRGHKLEAPWREALVPLVEQLRDRRQTAYEAFVGALDGERAGRTIARLDALVERSSRRAHTGEPLVARATSLMTPLVAAVVRAARAARTTPTPDALHTLRVRIKRLRYALEILHDADPALAKTTRRLIRLQEWLGAHQDAVTQIDSLRRCVDDDALPRPTLVAMGLLIAALDRRARRIRRRTPARLRGLARQLPRRIAFESPMRAPRPGATGVRGGARPEIPSAVPIAAVTWSGATSDPDHDDSHGTPAAENFALLLHGAAPKDSRAQSPRHKSSGRLAVRSGSA